MVSAIPAAAARTTGPSNSALMPPPPRARRQSRLGGRRGCGGRRPAARRPHPGSRWGAPTTDLAECGRQPVPAVVGVACWCTSETPLLSQVRSDRPHWVTSVGASFCARCSGVFFVQPPETTPVVVVLNDELSDWEQRVRGLGQLNGVRDLAAAVDR